jgi:LPXTG-site transpeptidase (sortase) family protein
MLTHRLWLITLRRFLLGLMILAFAWGVFALVSPGGMTIALTPTPTPEPALARELPRAWVRPTQTLPPSVTPTTTPTSTPTATQTPTSTPSPTPSAVLSPTPSPTATPVHRPADGDPTRITAPTIELDAKIVLVKVKEQYENGVRIKLWNVADYAAGFHQGSARPGYVGNTVISGHNNIRGEVFHDLNKLHPGDDIYLWVGVSPYRYKVGVIYRVPIKGAPTEITEDNVRWIQATDDERLTLVTCWPPWSNTHRTIVIAFPAPWDG